MSLSVFAAAREAGNATAVVASGLALTYGELAARVRRVIGWLQARGVAAPATDAPLCPVALIARADLPTLELLHALIALGIPVLPLHPRLTQRERELVLSECRAAELLDGSEVTFASSALAAEPPQVPDDERCLSVVQTSGSSGRPRGVVLSRRAAVAAARASAENLGFRVDDRWLIHLPLSHIGGLSIVTRCLLKRSAVVLAEPAASFDAADLARVVAREKVTLVSLVPTQLLRLLELSPEWRPPRTLRAVLLGGAAASTELVERAERRGVPILLTYGLTEACSQVATQRPGTRPAPGVVGPPLPGVEVRIEAGEIQIRGPTLFTSYHPDAGNPLEGSAWFRTGDLGRLDAQGNLSVMGRSRELIITGGENVHPREVEAVLESISGVHSACVFGLPDPTWGEIVAAALVPSERRAELDLSLVRAQASKELAPFKRPRKIAVLPELPELPNGKPDRPEVIRKALPLLRSVDRF